MVAFLAKFQSVVHSYHKLRVNIGDFQVKRVIGRGNFGDVKLAKEKGSGAVYALKVMKKGGDNTSAFFSEERDIMAQNNSPWLTKLEKTLKPQQPPLSLLLVKLISAYCCGCSQSFDRFQLRGAGQGRGSALCEVVSPGKEETVNRINDHSIPGPAWSPFSDYNNNCSD